MVHKTFNKANLTLKKLRKYHSRICSHYVSDLKKATLSLFNLEHLKSNPQELAEHVQYLLEDDRFLCLPENCEVRDLLGGHISLFNGKKNGQDLKLHFFGPVLVATIFRKHFEGIKSRGRKNQEVWIASFSGPFFLPDSNRATPPSEVLSKWDQRKTCGF